MKQQELIQMLMQRVQGSTDRIELLKRYPGPVARYLRYHLPEGIPGRDFSAVRMKGIIKLVNWSFFRSELTVNPLKGFYWGATVKMGILPVKGYDYFLEGKGAVNWRMFNMIPVMRSEGEDVSRSAEGRLKAEAVFAPHVLIHPSVEWQVHSENEISATWTTHREAHPLHLVTDENGALKKAFVQRWGNPGDGKKWRYINFGINVIKEAGYHGTVIPVKGNAGWWFGSKEYDDGEMFRFDVI